MAKILSACVALSLVACTSGKPNARRSLTPSASSSETVVQEEPEVRFCGAAPANHGDNGQLVRFIDDKRGWVGAGPSLLATNDGGRTWRTQYKNVAVFLQIDFIDAKRGWAVSCDLLLRTTDGGEHWVPLKQPDQPIVAVDFVSPQIGWGLSRFGALYHTTNGGKSWERLLGRGQVQSMCLTGPKVGWIAKRDAISKTTDGGKSWKRALQANRNPRWASGSLDCLGANVWALFAGGIAAVRGGHAVYRSRDAGGSWKIVLGQFANPDGTSPAPPVDAYADAFQVVTSNLVWFSGHCPVCQPQERPSVSVTTDSGRHWRRHYLGRVSGIPVSVFFVDQIRGWVVLGSFPDVRLFATTDGGLSWRLQVREETEEH
jgi:photosystem II stability/assembly factor-like uncharacterized protein